MEHELHDNIMEGCKLFKSSWLESQNINPWRTTIKTKYNLEFTSTCKFTFKEATEVANLWSKGFYADGKEADWFPEYNTTIKVETEFPTDECWGVSNCFDPDVRKANETKI